MLTQTQTSTRNTKRELANFAAKMDHLRDTTAMAISRLHVARDSIREETMLVINSRDIARLYLAVLRIYRALL